MTHIQIMRHCPSCRSEDIELLPPAKGELDMLLCRACGDTWSGSVPALAVTPDPLASVLLKWRPRR